MRKTSDENRAKPCKDTHSCSETFHMEHLHSQPELTYILGLKNAEPVKDRTLQVFILPEYSWLLQSMHGKHRGGRSDFWSIQMLLISSATFKGIIIAAISEAPYLQWHFNTLYTVRIFILIYTCEDSYWRQTLFWQLITDTWYNFLPLTLQSLPPQKHTLPTEISSSGTSFTY